MNNRNRTLAIVVTLAALSGCVQTSPKVDSNFVSSVRASLAAQVADPAATGNGQPVTGIDGRAAAASQQRYEASFARPVDQNSPMTGPQK